MFPLLDRFLCAIAQSKQNVLSRHTFNVSHMQVLTLYHSQCLNGELLFALSIH